MNRHTVARFMFMSLVVYVAPFVAAAATTCTVGRVSLATVPKATYILGNDAYSVSFCTADTSATASLQSCSGVSTSFVQYNWVNTTACINAYSNVLVGLTQYTAATESGVFFTTTTADVNTIANVTVVCDTTGSASTAALASASFTNSSGTSVLSLRFLSYAGCSVSSLFCSATTACASSSKSCVNGICFQKGCATLTTLQTAVYNSSATSMTFQVADCTGTPLSGLNSSDFSLSVGGIDVTQAPYSGEVPTGFAVAAQTVPAVTTLLLDQSASVTSGSSQALLQQAAATYVSTVVAANPSHYVALIAFDGSNSPVVVQPYTTDSAAIISSINTRLPPSTLTDPSSTNLYGAVISAIKIANDQRFSFGPANTSVLSTMIVFTDGFDTSGRSTAAAAIAAANAYASTVSIISIGVAATSDTAFLQNIATSGIYSFPSSSALITSFTDVANQVALRANSVYTKTLCLPVRSGLTAVSVSLNATEGFTTITPSAFTVNASTLLGGCTATTVSALAQATTVNSTANSPTKIALGTSLTQSIAGSGAFFFDVSQTVSATSFPLTVEPSTLSVLYVVGSRCQLSSYCYDAVVNGSVTVPATLGTTVHFMALNPATTALTATITAGVIITTPAPVSASTPTPTTATPAPTVTSVSSLLIYNVSETVSGDVDNDATWVFFGYGMLLLVFGAAVVIFKFCFVPLPGPDANRGALAASMYTRVPLQIGVAPGGDSAVYARTPSIGLQTPGGANRSVMQPQSLMMSPNNTGYAAPSLGTGVSPYRAAPFRTQLPSGRSFYDPSLMTDHHLSGARWSPRRDQDDL